MSLFKEIVKLTKKNNPYAFTMDQENPYEVKEWTKTGCYILNAVLSDGDIFKGVPEGKRIMISGQSSTAKSLFTSYILKSYLRSHENSYAIFFETEGSSAVEMSKSVGIPEDRIVIIPVATIEECRTQVVNILDKIIDQREGFETTITASGEKKRKKTGKKGESDEKFIMCIDSLGMLSTLKETTDIAAGKDTRDMTRAQLLKGFARATSLKLSVAGIPLVIVNHTYATMDKYSPQEVSGGTGPKYMSDIHLMLTKSKEKEGKEQVGVKINVNVIKSRYMIENKRVPILLHFKKGLYKYSGLVELAYELGLFKKEGISFLLPDGTKAKMKDVRQKARKFLNETVLNAVRDIIKENFSFGELENEDIEELVEETDGDSFDENDEIQFGDE